jgi:hypothetical protein
MSEINGGSWKLAAEFGDALRAELLLLGEDEEQAFVGEEMVENAAEEGRLRGAGADRRHVEPRQVHEPLQALAIGGKEAEGVYCKDFSFFGVGLCLRSHHHVSQLTTAEAR